MALGPVSCPEAKGDVSKHHTSRRGSARLSQPALAAFAVLLAGCNAIGAEGPESTPPPDAVQIRVYTNGGERFPESVRWRFRSVRAADQWGVVTHIPEATCVFVGPQWGLEVTTDRGGHAVVNAAAERGHFSGASPLDLAITRDDNGRVTVTEGLPEWWDGPPIRCAPN